MIRIDPLPPPSRERLADAMRALSEKRSMPVRPYDAAARDPVFIRRVRPLFDWFYDHYFRCETELVADVPEGPVLAVANHNGMSGMPDMFCHMTAFWRRYGDQQDAYGLMHDFPFRVPWAGPWLNACGALAACPDNARRVLSRGGKMLVFPGGDIDACKPYRDRYRICFAGRRGFLRVAIRHRVPILPIVSVGGHSSLYLLSDGRPIARALRLPELVRSNVFPIGFALPYGIIFGNPMPHIPPPVKIHTRFLAPVDLGLAPADAEDPEALEQAYRTVVAVMQEALDELALAGRHGLFPRPAP